jgi:hypothetical protein
METAKIVKDKKKLWLLTASAYLVIIAVIGAIMRYKFAAIFPVFDFNFILHVHSHVAMLGWVYTALFTALMYKFLPASAFDSPAYKRIFWIIQISVIGMLITFPIKGYWALSIVFSTLHIFVTYYFIYRFRKDVSSEIKNKYPASLLFINGGLILLIISTLGPFALAVIMADKLGGKDLYNQAIYFYLHFQYNGWFTLGLAGIILSKLEEKGITLNMSSIRLSFWLIFISCIPAYFLSLLSYSLPQWIIIISAVSAFIQLFGALILLRTLLAYSKMLLNESAGLVKSLFYISVFSFFLKFILQLLSSSSYFSAIVFGNRDIIIGYIHLVMLGMVTCGLLWWFSNKEFFDYNNSLSKSGLLLFLSGFVLSEVLLFMQFLIYYNAVPNLPYHMILFISAILMLAGFMLLWFKQYLLLRGKD